MKVMHILDDGGTTVVLLLAAGGHCIRELPDETDESHKQADHKAPKCTLQNINMVNSKSEGQHKKA